MAYLSVPEFTSLTIAPSEHVTEVEARYPGWLTGQLTHYSGLIDSRLRKRYVTPFASPAPEVVKLWLAKLVTPELYLKRGIDASDAQWDVVVRAAQDVESALKEAADAKEGLYDLPLRADTHTTGIAKPVPLFSSYSNPRTFFRKQRDRGYKE